MRAREIAETLLNGNISDAREAMTFGGHIVDAREVLDVVEELADMLPPGDLDDTYEQAIGRVRRCLNGGT